jgi:protein-S-isoprenylcysteine O-methyltransferase Ste14
MKQIRPPAYLLAGIVISVTLHLLLPLQQILVFPWRLFGFLPLFVGIVLNVLADRAFKCHNTTVKPLEKSSALVTAGVFKISRNPMYLGMSLIILGIAMLLGSASPFAVAVLLAVLFDRLFISTEERMLEETFGDRFREYCKRVRRWI